MQATRQARAPAGEEPAHLGLNCRRGVDGANAGGERLQSITELLGKYRRVIEEAGRQVLIGKGGDHVDETALDQAAPGQLIADAGE